MSCEDRSERWKNRLFKTNITQLGLTRGRRIRGNPIESKPLRIFCKLKKPCKTKDKLIQKTKHGKLYYVLCTSNDPCNQQSPYPKTIMVPRTRDGRINTQKVKK